MNIDALRETANLAHLNLSEAELAAAFPAFEQMVGFFAAMQAADEDQAAFSTPIAGLSHAARMVSPDHFRPDDVDFLNNRRNAPDFAPSGAACSGNLIDNAGERDGRFIVVPNVL